MHAILRARGVTTSVAMPISARMLAWVEDYFAARDAYRDGNVEPIVEFTAHATLDAVDRGSWLAAELQDIRTEWDSILAARKDSLAWQALDLLIRRPVLTTAAVAEEFAVSAETARNALDRLEADGIAFSSQVNKRQRAWRSPDVLSLLDDFAAAARRRSPEVLNYRLVGSAGRAPCTVVRPADGLTVVPRTYRGACFFESIEDPPSKSTAVHALPGSAEHQS